LIGNPTFVKFENHCFVGDHREVVSDRDEKDVVNGSSAEGLFSHSQ
jgi:hypothetical protein